jgi:peptidoglycan-N-acetylglucosamine deacetylase
MRNSGIRSLGLMVALSLVVSGAVVMSAAGAQETVNQTGNQTGHQSGHPSGQPQPEPNGVGSDVRVDACASDPSRLGLTRIVEIDTAGGPQFGGGHGAATDFLKDGEVILTFDDGPMRSHTRVVLKALAEECTKATFFMVGRMAAADPAMVKEVAAAGHTVASHTWSHQNLVALGFLKARQEFEMGLSAVNKALGHPAAAFFRFPYLSQNRFIEAHAKSRNISSIWVDVDSKDYMTRDSKIVHSRIMAQLKTQRKGIILMHDIQPSTAGAIKGLLRDLHDKGFNVVHIVPKSSASAVAMYDGAVDRTFEEKSKAAAANPLANRSVVWSMANPGAAVGRSPPGAGAKQPAKADQGPAGSVAAIVPPPATPAAVPAEEELPWLKKPAAEVKTAVPAPVPAKPRKPVAAAQPQKSWTSSIFGY